MARADSAASLQARLQRANSKSSLDDPALKPWHLKMTYQIFDAKGVTTERGTIEEWWRDPATHKTVYTGTSYAGVEIATKGKIYRTKGMPEPSLLVSSVLAEVVHPLPDANEVSGTELVLYPEDAGNTRLDCIVLNGNIKSVFTPTMGVFPSYCLDHSGDTLLVTYDYGTQMMMRNRVGTFQGREVAVDQTAAVSGTKAATAHVETLEGVAVSELDFTPASDMEMVGKAEDVASGLLEDHSLVRVFPVYPERARAHHAFGTVQIDVLIGQDGHIDKMKLISAADADLAASALAAVRQWTYRPYLMNGHPVAVNTTIKVNYDIR